MNKTTQTAAIAALLALVALAGTELLLRGTLRASKGTDLAAVYISALRLRHHENPYPFKDFLNQWHEAGAPADETIDDSGQHPIYPPTALVVMAPLAKLSWPWAIRCYAWACTLGYLGLVYLLARLVGNGWRSLRRLGFIAFALGISSVHAGIGQANPSAMVLVLCGYALYLAYGGDRVACGILLSLAFCVKPASALATVAIILLYGRIRSALTFLGVSALITSCAALAMLHVDQQWRTDYQSNLQALFHHNGAADFTASNAGRFDLVNLQVPLYSVFGSVRVADTLAIGATAALLVSWLFLFRRDSILRADTYWLSAGTLCLIGLLPVYQRNYNAGIILFVAVWAFQNIHELHAKAVLLASIAFLFPGEAFLRRTGLDMRFSGNALWDGFVMSELTWSIVAVIIVCLLSMPRNPAYGRQKSTR
jgi:hypothetical protein